MSKLTTLKNETKSPQAFYNGAELITVQPGEEVSGEYDENLLNALRKASALTIGSGKKASDEKEAIDEKTDADSNKQKGHK